MKRRLFTILSALSLPLCVLVVASAALGYLPGGFRTLRWTRETAGGVVIYRLGLAPLGWFHSRTEWPREFGPPVDGLSVPVRQLENRQEYSNPLWTSWSHVAPFPYQGTTVRVGQMGFGVKNTYPFLLSAALPCWQGVVYVRNHLRRRRNSRDGLCPACGYDLRATPHRCPECGREAGAEKE